jgi:hypothetical protein
LLRLEKGDVTDIKGLRENFELGTVAIRFFFASGPFANFLGMRVEASLRLEIERGEAASPSGNTIPTVSGSQRTILPAFSS